MHSHYVIYPLPAPRRLRLRQFHRPQRSQQVQLAGSMLKDVSQTRAELAEYALLFRFALQAQA